jgi:hypothetical protein
MVVLRAALEPVVCLPMKIVAWIIEETDVRLWGLTPRERLRRLLLRAGVQDLVEGPEEVPEGARVLLLRGDYLYEERVLRALAASPEVLLTAPSADGGPVPVAAHVPGERAAEARAVLAAGSADALAGLAVSDPVGLVGPFQERLRKAAPPFVLPITVADREGLEVRLFGGAYKGITDLVTKWLWPRPARQVTRWCVRLGLSPNQVTVASLVLAVAAGVAFAQGHHVLGLLAGWLMTFLDTVDGKLARVTVTSTRFGHVLDHGLDIIHPPLWYWAWGLGLERFDPGVAGLSVEATFAWILGGYVLGRAVEGGFQLFLGRFGIFCWRPVDSYFRLVTARRNPNLILLTVGLAAGRPDLGFLAVAAWTVLTTGVLLLRLGAAVYARLASGPLRSWLADVESGVGADSLAARWFAGRPARP